MDLQMGNGDIIRSVPAHYYFGTLDAIKADNPNNNADEEWDEVAIAKLAKYFEICGYSKDDILEQGPTAALPNKYFLYDLVKNVTQM